MAIGAGAVIVALGWVFLFSSVFAVTTIIVNGATMNDNDRVLSSVRQLLERRTLQLLQPDRNIVLLDTDAVRSFVLEEYASIQGVQVRKEYPHTLRVDVIEREAFGVWCRGDDCSYVDRTGARWGSAVSSRGPLLVRVEDERTDDDLPLKLMAGLLAAIDGLPPLGLHVVSVTLPDSAPGDTRLLLDAGYSLLMDVYADTTDQLATLGVLLADKAKDSAWKPQYVDIRTPGRAYFRPF
jgi:cell division septal protein FtsQ